MTFPGVQVFRLRTADARRRYSEGVKPNASLNLAAKYPISIKPHFIPISDTGHPVVLRYPAALFRRW